MSNSVKLQATAVAEESIARCTLIRCPDTLDAMQNGICDRPKGFMLYHTTHYTCPPIAMLAAAAAGNTEGRRLHAVYRTDDMPADSQGVYHPA